jgi:hypothetical protein
MCLREDEASKDLEVRREEGRQQKSLVSQAQTGKV